MADPNQPTSLNKAITPVGTCDSMCPEFERVERIVQKMVDKSEKVGFNAPSFILVPCNLLTLQPTVPAPNHQCVTKYGDQDAQAFPSISSWI